jgi:hypothetical protein
MKLSTYLLIAIVAFTPSFKSEACVYDNSKPGSFNKEKDLLLAQFDCKTDVDDLHSVAALVTLLNDSSLSGIHYHAVAGTYGIQGGLYVPPNDLFQSAFGDNWTDAHENIQGAVERVMIIVKATLANDGDVWIAEAGQSDFTASLVKAIQSAMPELKVSQRIHVVQHSEWNEQSTSPENLQHVKESTDYQKIPDGNAVGNGSPGFRSPEFTEWRNKLTNPQLIAIWQLAIDLSNKYNGKEGRYNNEAISSGGLDFSDLSEVCWILGLQHIRDTEEFFKLFAK